MISVDYNRSWVFCHAIWLLSPYIPIRLIYSIVL